MLSRGGRDIVALFFLLVFLLSICALVESSARKEYMPKNMGPQVAKDISMAAMGAGKKRAHFSQSNIVLPTRHVVEAELTSRVKDARARYESNRGDLAHVYVNTNGNNRKQTCNGGMGWFAAIEGGRLRSECKEWAEWSPSILRWSTVVRPPGSAICSVPHYELMYPQCEFGYHCDIASGTCVFSKETKRNQKKVTLQYVNNTEASVNGTSTRSYEMQLGISNIGSEEVVREEENGKEEEREQTLAEMIFKTSRAYRNQQKRIEESLNEGFEEDPDETRRIDEEEEEKRREKDELPPSSMSTGQGGYNSVAEEEKIRSVMTTMPKCPERSGLVWSREKKRCVQCLSSSLPLPLSFFASPPFSNAFQTGFLCDLEGNRVAPLQQGIAEPISKNPRFSLLLAILFLIIVIAFFYMSILIHKDMKRRKKESRERPTTK